MSSPENHTPYVNTFKKFYGSRLLKQFSLYLKNEKRFCFQIFAFGSLNAWQFDRLKKRIGCIWFKKGQSGTLKLAAGCQQNTIWIANMFVVIIGMMETRTIRTIEAQIVQNLKHEILA